MESGTTVALGEFREMHRGRLLDGKGGGGLLRAQSDKQKTAVLC